MSLTSFSLVSLRRLRFRAVSLQSRAVGSHGDAGCPASPTDGPATEGHVISQPFVWVSLGRNGEWRFQWETEIWRANTWIVGRCLFSEFARLRGGL